MKRNNLSDLVAEFILQCRNEELAKLSVTKVAGIFKVGESFLSQKFTEDKNITVGNYICRERMLRAALLLTGNRRFPIKFLSETMGFYDYEYFARTFKNYFGVLPSRYRYLKKMSYKKRGEKL